MTSRYQEFLKQSAVLGALTSEQLAEIAPYVSIRRFEEQEVVFEEGDEGDGMYVLVTGSAQVFVEGHNDGTRMPLAILAPGQCFGEMALLDRQPRSATVKALSPSTCLFVPVDRFSHLLARDATVARALLPVLTQRLRDADRWIQALL